MEQNKSTTKTNKNESTSIRFDKVFVKKISKLVDKANKKTFGKKVYPKDIISKLFELSDESMIQKAVNESQEDSITHKDRKKMFLKEFASKVSGGVEALESEMMELLKQKYSQNLNG